MDHRVSPALNYSQPLVSRTPLRRRFVLFLDATGPANQTPTDVWLFDCGEATQHQLIRLNGDPKTLAVRDPMDPNAASKDIVAPKLSRVSAVFLTLARRPLLWAPWIPGTKSYVQGVLDATLSRIGRGIVLHEMLIPSHLSHADDLELVAKLSVTRPPHIDELDGSDFIASSFTTADSMNRADWYWTIITGNEQGKSGASRLTVQASPIPHTVTTVGYFVTEPQIPGWLRADQITPILQRNKAALGLKNPMILLSKIKNGETLTMPDGTKQDATPNSNADECVVDLVIHEATNSCLASDIAAGLTPDSVESTTIEHGHSTPQMAAQFARRVGAGRLVLNHFSSRYKGDADESS
ncbi:Metallo-hydrolase/oxidoreductase [Chytriomyces cf. hyalinus JEL632]|nr:Metallo-hydrolase/oxidoreductase [Chytriomyces cf. hyalinus JEL632]